MSKRAEFPIGRGLLAAALTSFVTLTGCVSTKTTEAPAEQLSKWQGKTVALSDRPRAGFAPMTAGKAMLGLLGTAALIEAGKTIVAENGIEDPAPVLARELLAAGEKKYGVVPASIPPVKVDTGDVAQLAKAAKGADILLDVQNVGFGWIYHSTDWGHYRVITSYKLRIVDVAKSVLIAEGFCARKSEDSEMKTKDELLADHAALLKTTINDQRDACRKDLGKQVLALTGE